MTSDREVTEPASTEIFPLPLLPDSYLKRLQLPLWKAKIVLEFANVVVLALNFLFGLGSQAVLPHKLTLVQEDVASRVLERCADFNARLQSTEDGSWEHLLPDWFVGVAKPEGPKYAHIQADAVDCLPVSGACDPLPCLPEEVRAVIMEETFMFPEPPTGLNRFGDVDEESRDEYVKLVARQLRCQKLGLASTVKGGGVVLAVSKPGTGKQREVWHGRRVSQAARGPPPPRHLASPTALLYLEATREKPIRISKRDAKCWFDQLLLPTHLRTWMARPPVTVSELCEGASMSLEEANSCLEEGSALDSSCFYPVSKVWPMGFSWSSYVAQEVLLDCIATAGIGDGQVLACDNAV